MKKTRTSYPSDVSDAEWEFLAPFLALMREDAPQREYPLRTLFNAMRYVVKTGCPWCEEVLEYFDSHHGFLRHSFGSFFAPDSFF